MNTHVCKVPSNSNMQNIRENFPQAGKVFTLDHGPDTIRAALQKRGWVEKNSTLKYGKAVQTYAKSGIFAGYNDLMKNWAIANCIFTAKTRRPKFHNSI